MLAAHAEELFKLLWLVLIKVEGLHRPGGSIGHHRHAHSGHLAAAAADGLHLADSAQDGIHLGLEAPLRCKYILISGSIKPQDHIQIAGWKGEM